MVDRLLWAQLGIFAETLAYALDEAPSRLRVQVARLALLRGYGLPAAFFGPAELPLEVQPRLRSSFSRPWGIISDFDEEELYR